MAAFRSAAAPPGIGAATSAETAGADKKFLDPERMPPEYGK